MFGLGETSGLEIPEAEPHISDEYSIQSAIGQGNNNYTVSQLNRYVTAVANNGTVYDLTLVDKTTDANGKLIKDYEAAVDHTIDEISQTTWDAIHTGMEQVVASTASFNGLDFTMAGKTGTAQHNELHADHVLFVGYAPAESPQISIAVRITYGYNSGYSAEIGRDIARVYFNQDAAQEVVTGSAADLGTGIAGD
jgi:penicillin-binding protein 2